MLKRSSKKKKKTDINELASQIVSETTEDTTVNNWDNEGRAIPESDGKNPAAVALGRLGGLKGGKARAKNMTKKERSESARKAALARWKKKNPES